MSRSRKKGRDLDRDSAGRRFEDSLSAPRQQNPAAAGRTRSGGNADPAVGDKPIPEFKYADVCLVEGPRDRSTAHGVDELHWSKGKKSANLLTLIYQVDEGCRPPFKTRTPLTDEFLDKAKKEVRP